MDCKTIRKQIGLFIENKLSYEETLDFVDHIEGCKECMEELTIQYLVTEGMNRLEEGGDFDLNSELEHFIRRAGEKAQMFYNIRFGIGLASMVSVFAVIMVLIRMFIL